MTAQTPRMSLVESLANVAIGFGVSFVANLIVLPWFGYTVSTSQAIGIGLVMTVISIARSFALRRGFEWLRVNSQGR